jgi:hypothetical protein
MRYMLALYDDESRWFAMPPEQIQQELDRYEAFGREAGDAIVAGDGLQPTATATTVRVRDGEPALTDGPFAETKEQLGGFYVLECANLDEALGWAAKVPAADTGSVEVRPVMDYQAEGAQDPNETAEAAR